MVCTQMKQNEEHVCASNLDVVVTIAPVCVCVCVYRVSSANNRKSNAGVLPTSAAAHGSSIQVKVFPFNVFVSPSFFHSPFFILTFSFSFLFYHTLFHNLKLGCRVFVWAHYSRRRPYKPLNTQHCT